MVTTTQGEWARNNKERKREINRRSREKHLEKVQEYYRLKERCIREENPEISRERVRKNYWKNPKPHAIRMKQWRQANPEKVNYYNQKYREMLNLNGGTFTFEEWMTLCELYDFRCLCCGKQTKLTPDHVIPVVHNGLNDIENIQPLCKSCNSRKHSKMIDFRVHVFVSLW